MFHSVGMEILHHKTISAMMESRPQNQRLRPLISETVTQYICIVFFKYFSCQIFFYTKNIIFFHWGYWNFVTIFENIIKVTQLENNDWLTGFFQVS